MNFKNKEELQKHCTSTACDNCLYDDACDKALNISVYKQFVLGSQEHFDKLVAYYRKKKLEKLLSQP